MVSNTSSNSKAAAARCSARLPPSSRTSTTRQRSPKNAQVDVVAALPKVNLNPVFMLSLERLAAGAI